MNIVHEVTPELVKLLGKKWAGKYEIRVMSALDYVAMWDELYNKKLPTTRVRMNYFLLLKSVFHDGKPIEEDVPPKLMEMLMPDVIKLNAYVPEEEEELFLQSPNGSPKTKAAPDPNTTTP